MKRATPQRNDSQIVLKRATLLTELCPEDVNLEEAWVLKRAALKRARILKKAALTKAALKRAALKRAALKRATLKRAALKRLGFSEEG